MFPLEQRANEVITQLTEAIRTTPLGASFSIVRFGIDICSIPQMREALEDERFAERFFTDRERLHCGWVAERYASNFAAKEAVIKVFQAWPKWPNRLTEIEILHESSGAPYVYLTGSAREMRDSLGIEQLLVSASHEADFAIAACLGFGRGQFHHRS